MCPILPLLPQEEDLEEGEDGNEIETQGEREAQGTISQVTTLVLLKT